VVITKLKLDKDRKAKLVAKAANGSKGGAAKRDDDVAMSNVDSKKHLYIILLNEMQDSSYPK